LADVMAGVAALALALAAMGLYGVIANLIGLRTREIGIRIALGARAEQVYRLVIAEGVGPIVVGVIGGLGAALALARVLRMILYEVSAFDPLTFLAVAVGLSGVALVATLVPARHALRIDPAIALRAD
jgi:putative ABC transport system permease protein